MGNNVQPRVGNLNYDAKLTEKLGSSNKDTVSFDDFDFVQGKFNYRIAEVKIWHDGKYILGIQTIYEMDGGKKTPGSHVGSAKAPKCESLSLKNDEHITKIIVRSGSWIDAIAIYTDQGRSIQAGGNGGSPTSFQLSQGYHFVAFSGGVSKYVDFLQATFDKID